MTSPTGAIRLPTAATQSAGAAPASGAAPDACDTLRIAGMALAHFVNDSYGQYLAILLPLLAISIGFDVGRATIIVTAYTITSSIIQPLLGHFADRHTTRLISVLGLAAAAIGGSLLGISPNFLVLVLFAVLAGLGTAMYHPQAAAMVVAIAGRRKSTMMSFYLVGGSIGFALGPKIVQWVANRDLHATPLLMLPGLAMALALALLAPRGWAPVRSGGESPSLWGVLRAHRRILSLLLGVVVLRSWTQLGVSTFLPFYYSQEYADHQYASNHAANVIAVFSLTGAFGGLLGGFLADRFGQKPVIVLSLIAAGPLLLVLPHVDGPALYLIAAASGILLLSSWNVLTVKGQTLLSHNVGMASGLMLGFSIGLGGLGAIPLGFVGDQTGILPILVFCALLAPLAGLLALRLPD
ncbi:MAG TPA: MFS transporter [Dehalococcoidia bacterium]|jgi:FSR family fosmidomycin resistance protein-like MFS transporter